MKNMQQIMKQAQKMQEQLQKQMAEMSVEGSAGGGMVSVKLNGLKQMLGVKIDPDAVTSGDVEMLQDLIVAAFNEAARKVDDELSTLAWLYHMNHGIFMTPGVEEEWTLSIAHEQEHIDRYVAAFEAFASGVSSS